MATRLACDLSAIPIGERASHQEVTRHLISSATRIRESKDGFTLQFSSGEYDSVTQFVGRERLCCPFLRFAVDVSPEQGGVELRIRGPADAKEFIRTELHLVPR